MSDATSSSGRGAGRGGGGGADRWARVRKRVSIANSINILSATGGGGGGRGYSGRGTVGQDSTQQHPRRRMSLLATMKMGGFRFSQRHLGRANSVEDVPEEGGDLHKHFRTCASLTRIREEFRNALGGENAASANSFGKNACAIPEEYSGRLLLHSIGLNSDLITHGGGMSTAAQSRVNQFVLNELLPAHPSAIIETDDKGRIPFIEPIERWIAARRAVRKWKIDTDRTREKVALVAAKLKNRMGAVAATREADSDSEESFSSQTNKREVMLRKGNSSSRSTLYFGSWSGNNIKQAREELKMIVDSSDDAMFCIDERGSILLTNYAAQKLFGYSKGEFVGSNISMICNSKDASRHGKYLEHYLETGEKRVIGKKRELLAKKKDGTAFYIELGLTEVDLGGGKFIFCGFVKDVTDIKRHRRVFEDAEDDNDDPRGAGNDNVAGEGGSRASRGIPPLVEWCLAILSEFVDNYEGGRAGLGGGDDEDDDESLDISFDQFKSMRGSLRDHSPPIAMKDTIVVEKVASIPHLLEELLLIDDLEARGRVFDMSIVHKVLFNPDSLGDGEWLISMLDKSIRVQKQKVLDANLSGADTSTAAGRALQLQLRMAQDECRFLAEGAVFYLERVSELNVESDLHVFHNMKMHQEVARNGEMADMISTGDLHHFQKRRNELFDAVGELRGLVRRLSALEDDLLKRAASTPVVRRRLDKIMFSPFATLSALFDGVNHFLLMMSFRLGPAPAMFHLSKNDVGTFQTQQYIFASAALIGSVSYFGTKAVHQSLAKRALSENLWKAEAFTFWSLLDSIPLLMVFFCTVAVDSVLRHRAHSEVADSSVPFLLRTAIAITTPVLWLRIMSFVKVRNKQLATFILCAVEIMKDIKWFLLVLFAAMASFAQMWMSFTIQPDESESRHYMEGYLKAYTIMLGDLDSDALSTHPLIALLFVLYTFGVTIVLLNILIAIVSDSYQNSFVSSKMMLGKARVMFASELLSVKSFHKMWSEGETATTHRNVNYMFLSFAVFHMWMITRTVNAKLNQGSLCQIDTLSPNQVRLEALLAFSFFFSLLFVMKGIIAYVLNCFNDTGGLCVDIGDRSSSRWQRTVNWFVQHAFSALSNSFDALSDGEDTRKELSHSPAAREHRADKELQRSIDKTRKALKAELKGMFEQLQLSLREMEEQNKQDVLNIEECISAALSTAIAESQEIMAQALQSEQDLSENGVPEVLVGEPLQNTVEEDGSDVSGSSLSLGELDRI